MRVGFRILLLGLFAVATVALGQSASWSGGSMALRPDGARLELKPAIESDASALLGTSKSHRMTLVLRGIATDRPPGTGYLVFLNLPEGVNASLDDPGYVGGLNFFGMPGSSEGRSARAVSFEISEVIERLAQVGRLDEALTLTIAPSGRPSPDAHPIIDAINIFVS